MSINNFPSHYEKSGGIYLPKGGPSTPFNYSDGEEFEKTIKTIISEASDRSLFSLELRNAIWNWPSSCHLSPVRANILRPFEAICRGRVLELGSGCGVITRYLGELGGSVVALEASHARAEITRLRTEDLSNVEVVCDRIEDFNAEAKFDVVTMIGVLQYARLFSNCSEQAEVRFIENAARQLNKDGVLVIAIQNKLSLKSLAGYPEPNVGLSYFGIENRYQSDTIIRFGLEELKSLLASAGLAYQEILFPFPDYHMPVSIMDLKAMMPSRAFNALPLLSTSVGRDRARPDWVTPSFSMERAWESVYSSGAAPCLSNAFLIIAGKTERALSGHREVNVNAWHYSADRHPSFAIQKKFVSVGKETIVQPSLLRPQQTPPVPIRHVLADEKYIIGKTWWEFLVEIVNNPGWSISEVANWAEPWISTLFPDFQRNRNLEAEVPGVFFDHTPLNCLKGQQGSLEFVDFEWELKGPISLSYVVIRGLYGSFAALSSSATPASGTPTLIVHLIQSVLESLGVSIRKEQFEEYALQEFRVQNWITQGIDNFPSDKWKESIFAASIVHRQTLQQLSAALNDANHNLQLARAHLDQIKNSKSWRLTTPLRNIRKY